MRGLVCTPLVQSSTLNRSAEHCASKTLSNLTVRKERPSIMTLQCVLRRTNAYIYPTIPTVVCYTHHQLTTNTSTHHRTLHSTTFTSPNSYQHPITISTGHGSTQPNHTLTIQDTGIEPKIHRSSPYPHFPHHQTHHPPPQSLRIPSPQNQTTARRSPLHGSRRSIVFL
jgi:hypothetical protein